MPAPSVSRSWQRIEAWLKAHAPEVLASFPPGATAKSLAACEAKLRLELPADCEAFYRTHDGQKEGQIGLFASVAKRRLGPGPSYRVLPLKEVVSEWSVWKKLVDGDEFAGEKSEPDKGIRDDWWHTGWVPIASNGGGDFFCIDLAPARGGTRGQVITMNHASGERKRVAPSLAAWLKQLADGLEDGTIVLSEDRDNLHFKEE